jgi:hypothetical protein
MRFVSRCYGLLPGTAANADCCDTEAGQPASPQSLLLIVLSILQRKKPHFARPYGKADSSSETDQNRREMMEARVGIEPNQAT